MSTVGVKTCPAPMNAWNLDFLNVSPHDSPARSWKYRRAPGFHHRDDIALQSQGGSANLRSGGSKRNSSCFWQYLVVVNRMPNVEIHNHPGNKGYFSVNSKG